MSDTGVLEEVLARVCRSHHWLKEDGEIWHSDKPLTDELVRRHLEDGRLVGACPITPGDHRTRLALFDIDNHAPKDGSPRLSDEVMQSWVVKLEAACLRQGLQPNTLVSSSGYGYHMLFLFDELVDAYSLRVLLKSVLADCGLSSGVKGLRKEQVEVFPKQASVPIDGVGSMFVLPFGYGTQSRWADVLAADEGWILTGGAAVPYVEMPVLVAQELNPDAYLCDAAYLSDVLGWVANGAAADLDYDAWFQIVCGIHDATNGSETGKALAMEWSAQSPKHDADFLLTHVWPYIRSDRTPRVSFRSVELRARAAGWRPSRELDRFGVIDVERDSNKLNDSDSETEVDSDGGDRNEGSGPVGAIRPLRAFIGALEAPHYIWDEVLQKGCLYALTALWGHGKTALMLSVVAHVASGRTLCGRQVSGETEGGGKVLYLCGENPADVRLRVVAGLARFGIDEREVEGRLWFTEKPFAIDAPRVLAGFLQEAGEMGPFDLVVIDTGPAHSQSDEENDNREMHALAIAMRDFMEGLGNPACVAMMHPSKGAGRDGLQPRGGGAFSGSIDGELCCWQDPKTRGVVELFHRTKFRGPGFEPMWWALERVEVAGMVTNFGKPVVTVVAVPCGRPVEPAKPQGKWQVAVMGALTDLGGLDGEGVSMDALLEHLIDGGAEYDARKRQRESIRRAVAAMVEGDLIGLELDVITVKT